MLQVRYAKAPGVEVVMAPAPHQLQTLMLTLGFSRDSLLPALNSSFRSWREAELASSMVWWGSGWKVSDKGRGCGFESRLQHQVEDAMGWYTALPVIIPAGCFGECQWQQVYRCGPAHVQWGWCFTPRFYTWVMGSAGKWTAASRCEQGRFSSQFCAV